MRARGSSTHRLARDLAVRLGYLALLGLFVVALVQGGTRYFFCPLMNATFTRPCCEEARNEEQQVAFDSDLPSVRAPDCCKAKSVGVVPVAVPSSTQTHDGSLALSPAVLPSFECAKASWKPEVRARFRRPPVRAGPSARRRRADLMTWNC